MAWRQLLENGSDQSSLHVENAHHQIVDGQHGQVAGHLIALIQTLAKEVELDNGKGSLKNPKADEKGRPSIKKYLQTENRHADWKYDTFNDARLSKVEFLFQALDRITATAFIKPAMPRRLALMAAALSGDNSVTVHFLPP